MLIVTNRFNHEGSWIAFFRADHNIAILVLHITQHPGYEANSDFRHDNSSCCPKNFLEANQNSVCNIYNKLNFSALKSVRNRWEKSTVDFNLLFLFWFPSKVQTNFSIAASNFKFKYVTYFCLSLKGTQWFQISLKKVNSFIKQKCVTILHRLFLRL